MGGSTGVVIGRGGNRSDNSNPMAATMADTSQPRSSAPGRSHRRPPQRSNSVPVTRVDASGPGQPTSDLGRWL